MILFASEALSPLMSLEVFIMAISVKANMMTMVAVNRLVAGIFASLFTYIKAAIPSRIIKGMKLRIK